MDFLINKTELSKAVTTAKKLLAKKDTLIQFLIYENTLSINNATQHIVYHTNLEIKESTVEGFHRFQIDSKVLLDNLKGRNRDLKFELIHKTLICEELNLELPLVNYSETGTFNDLKGFPYNELENTEEFTESLTIMNKFFCENNHHYSNYLKLTDMNTTIFNPELFCVLRKKFNEHLMIDKLLGNNGLSIHKNAIDFFVSNYKAQTGKKLMYLIIKNQDLMIFKDGEEYYCFRFTTQIEYPNPKNFEPQWNGEKARFTKELMESIESTFKKIKPKKLYITVKKNAIDIYVDVDKQTIHSFPTETEMLVAERKYAFNYETFCKVFSDIDDKTEVFLSTFKNKVGEEGDVWIIDNGIVSKFLTGFNISSGFKIPDETKETFKKQLEKLETEIAIINRQAVSEK